MVDLAAGATVSVLVVEVFELLKQTPSFKWITTETATVNRYLGFVLAFLSGLGIHYQFDQTTGTLVIQGLAWASIGHAAMQWAQQQLYYRLVVKEVSK